MRAAPGVRGLTRLAQASVETQASVEMELFVSASLMVLNVASAVLMVCLCRVLMTDYGFVFASSLCGFHFWAGALVMKAAEMGKWVEPGHMPISYVLAYAVIGSVSVGSASMSLLLNSVSFYQISKLCVVPFVMLVEVVAFKRTQVTALQVLFMCLVVVGVGVVTVTELQFNLLGALVALLFVCSSGMQQILCGSWQNRFGLASWQLLSVVSPAQGTLLVLIGPSMDWLVTRQWLLSWQPNMSTIGFVLLTCLVAVALNLSQFACLGRVSATSFQVLGHAKTVLILTGGWLYLGDYMTGKKVLGILTAITGMVGYTTVVSMQQRTQPAPSAGSLDKDGDASQPLLQVATHKQEGS